MNSLIKCWVVVLCCLPAVGFAKGPKTVNKAAKEAAPDFEKLAAAKIATAPPGSTWADVREKQKANFIDELPPYQDVVTSWPKYEGKVVQLELPWPHAMSAGLAISSSRLMDAKNRGTGWSFEVNLPQAGLYKIKTGVVEAYFDSKKNGGRPLQVIARINAIVDGPKDRLPELEVLALNYEGTLYRDNSARCAQHLPPAVDAFEQYANELFTCASSALEDPNAPCWKAGNSMAMQLRASNDLFFACANSYSGLGPVKAAAEEFDQAIKALNGWGKLQRETPGSLKFKDAYGLEVAQKDQALTAAKHARDAARAYLAKQ